MIRFYRPTCSKCGHLDQSWRIRGRDPAPSVGEVVKVTALGGRETEVCVTAVARLDSASGFDWSAAFVDVPPIPSLDNPNPMMRTPSPVTT